MESRRSWSLQGRLNLAAGTVFVLAAVAIVLLVNRQQRSAALRTSELRANAILERNRAVHAFFSEELRPAVDRIADRVPGGAPFDPVWMSSSYAARSIDRRVPSSRGVYYYKECAIDARNPGSEADAVEREFLERAAKDPSLTGWTGERTIDGKPWFVVMRRGETMQRSCLECHSRPELAPAGLVERYGPTRSFGRREGDLVSVLSVRVPLDATYADVNAFSMKLSAALLGALAALFLAQWVAHRTLLYGPLRRLQREAVALAAGKRRRGEPLPVPAVRELREVTAAFNAMADSIARHTDELEAQVEQRTRQLMEREAQLRHAHKMEAVGRLAGGVAHDFNNLLTVIRGNADVLAEDLAPGEPRREEVDEIRDAAVRATSLTRQLLAFSRRDVSHHRAVRPDELVRELARLLDRLLPANVELTLDLDADGAVVSADPGQLEQVLVNLVVNARDALPGGGHIRLETREIGARDALAARDGLGEGPFMRITVTDDGVGIEGAVLPHVFEPFFTTKPRDQGTGLGLATAYGIVEQHGGRIAVDSAPGKGSSFRVYLPISAEATRDDDAAPQRRAPAPAPGSETVLVVEDEAAVRRLVVAALRRHGYRVLEADSGEQALRVADAEPLIDLLVTDVIMRGIAGDDLAERLRGRRANLRVILTSGYAPGEELRRQLGACGAAFLQKPFTSDELLARVRRVLEAAEPGARPAA